jgi:hypothetical protein
MKNLTIFWFECEVLKISHGIYNQKYFSWNQDICIVEEMIDELKN